MSAARRFIGRHALTFPHVRDEGRGTADRWGVSGLRETFFITSRGDVVAHVVGAIAQRQFDDGVKAAITGEPRPPQTGGAQGGLR